MCIKKKADFISGLVFIAMMGVLLLQGEKLEMPYIIGGGPKMFPYALMAGIVVCSLVVIFRSLDFTKEKTDEEGKEKKRLHIPTALQLIVFACLLVYICILPVIGYIPATFLFLFGEMTLLGKRTAKNLLIYFIISSAVTGLVYFIFAKMLMLFLP